MSSKFKSLKNQLRFLEENESASRNLQHKRAGFLGRSGVSNLSGYLLFGAFLISFILYASTRYSIPGQQASPPMQEFFSWTDQPDDQLLEDMGAWMEEMGYTDLTTDDLVDLRRQGVTATFTSRMRDLGYSDLTIDDLVRLRQNDVSSTFAAMMKELGYELSIEDLVQLRQYDVTAYFAGNMHDLGYTGITKDELIRLRDTGVTISEVQQLVQNDESLPPIGQLIRHHISNQ